MKLICLNIWGGTMFRPLMEFITEQSRDADIFCFQEVWDTPTTETIRGTTRINMLSELSLALPDFSTWFGPVLDGYHLGGRSDVAVTYGNAVFVRRTFPIIASSSTFVHKTGGAIPPKSKWEPRALQHIQLTTNGTPLSVYNFHGLVPVEPIKLDDPNGPDPKIDTADRIQQARRIRQILDADSGARILCGDFNLKPDTESMNIVRGSELENLIETHHITDTRGPLDQRPVRFADHMLVSSDIQVKNFEVQVLSISDHLPLMLTFDLA